MDAFELLFTSEDDPENGYGHEISPLDFRYIGYRVIIPDDHPGACDYLLEFSFTTWVRQVAVMYVCMIESQTNIILGDKNHVKKSGKTEETEFGVLPGKMVRF